MSPDVEKRLKTKNTIEAEGDVTLGQNLAIKVSYLLAQGELV